MSSRLPRSPHVPHSTTNAHPITASHAKSHVLAGVQDAYWSDDEDENLECPLCLEEMDLSDLHFKPCPCGYQICNFCWHHIKENLNGRCPACRREYTEQPAEFKSVTAEEQKRLNAQKRKRDKERKELEALNRRHLANVRIVQRNLVYVTGLGSRFAKEELLPSLRSSEYFGQYGKVSKILLVKRAATLNRPADVGVYITYHRREDAARAIAAVDGSPSPGGGGEIMRASYGTTKYCMNFLRGVQCTNNSCLDLHEWGDERDCFTKEDLATLKHAMKDSETRQAPAPAPRKRAEDTDGTSAPPMGAALPRGASWGQNRGALPPAPAVLPSSTSSAFPAITASLASSAQSSRQQRSAKARGAATERPATPGRNRRSERNRERGGKSTEAATTVSAIPGGLTASRPSTPALSNPSSRPSTASKSPRDAFKSPTLAAAQPTPLANAYVPAETTVSDTPSPETQEEDAAASVLSPPKPTPATPAMPPPPGLSLPPPPPGLAAVPQHAPATQSVPASQTSPSGTGPSQSQYQMSGAAKALLDDVRARREAAPPASTQQSPFPDFDRTLSNLTGGGFSFSFNMGSNAYNRSDVASGPYASTVQEDMSGPLPGRGVSGFFDPFRKSDTGSPLPPPPGLSVARPGSGYEQAHLSTHVEPKSSYTGAFNPFADGPGSVNRTSSYDSERDAAERTSSRFGFARRQDSLGQVSNGYGTTVTSSPMRLHDQLPEAPLSPPLATSTQWQYNHNAPDYGHQGMMPMGMAPNSLHQQLYAPPGLSQQHYPNGMELNAAGLKELLNIGGNLSGARIDARRSQSGTYIPPVIPLYDTFDARFTAQPFSDPAIMSVAPRQMFPTGPNLSQIHISQLGPNTPGQPQAILAGLQSPPGIHGPPVLSPPPGFAQPTRPYPARQNTQITHPLTGLMADSPMLTTASILKSEPNSPALSASDFPALPPPSTDTQTKRETNQPFLQSRVTAADAKAAALAAKKASGAVTKKAPSKLITTKITTKATTDDTPAVTSPSTSTLNVALIAEMTPKTVSGNSGPISKDSTTERPGKNTSSQVIPKASTDSRPTPAPVKSGSVERSQSNTGSVRGKPNPTPPSASTTKAPVPKPSILIPAPEPVEHVPVLSRKQKKNKPMPPRPVVKVPKDEPAKTESVTPSAPSSPVSTLLRFEDGSSPPTPLTAEPAMPPEPSIVGMLVDLAAQYEIERLSFFDSQSYNTKLATPLRYGPLVQALSTLSMGGSSAAKSITPRTIDTAVTSFQQLLETLTQTISDMLRTLPRTTWDDTSSFDGVLKDMLKAEEFLEENTDDLPNWRDDDVTVLTQALEKRARWMEIQLVKLEELHRDINTSAVRSVLDQNDRGWGPRAREPRGESLAAFEQLGYVEEGGVKRVMTIAELEAALVEAKEKETVAETELKEAMLTAY
ncbi:transcriptional repressor general negative regulator of transcription subunit 4 [Ceratobasidium sp. 423]|nr:transcriptional repressor general negative regulator of transcription subunit 4 [Ceratobasidium sp. 423]